MFLNVFIIFNNTAIFPNFVITPGLFPDKYYPGAGESPQVNCKLQNKSFFFAFQGELIK
jgi:hypothetical protein